MSNDKTYNGWTNYATWRINLEVFEGVDLSYFGFDEESDAELIDPYELKDAVKNYAEEVIFLDSHLGGKTPSSLMEEYAMAFLQEVNWYEIADHLIQNHIAENQE